MRHDYPYPNRRCIAHQCDLLQSHADAGAGFLPSKFPTQYVDDFKAWMAGPSAHEERVAGFKVTRENAGRAYERMLSKVNHEMYELHYLAKPLEDTYRKQCSEVALVNEKVQKSMYDMQALEQQLQATKAVNEAYHAKTSTNLH